MKITTRYIAGMTVVAIPDEARNGAFVKVQGYDRIQKSLVGTDSYVTAGDLATSEEDVDAAILFTVAMERPDVRATLLEAAIRKYPRSLFLPALQVAQGGAAAVGRETTPASGLLSVTVDGVNVRSAPDEARGTVINRLNKGTQVQVTERTTLAYSVSGTVAAWFHVRNPDGWMFGAFLEKAPGVLVDVPAQAAPLPGGGTVGQGASPNMSSQERPQVPVDDRLLAALVRIDLHLLVDYDLSVEKWPSLGVVQWPLIADAFPSSPLESSWVALEGALNRKDIASAAREAERSASLAAQAGLSAGAADIAQMVKRFADLTGDTAASSRMGALIGSLTARVADSPEFSSTGVEGWMLALKPGTLFVGDIPAVRALGLQEIENRFANMLEILAQDMVSPVDLAVCQFHPETPDHLIRDFWVLVQRLRVDTAKLESDLQKGDLEPVVQAVPYFNGSWGLVREIAQKSGCSTVGAYATWK